MKSNVPWSVKGIERDARETAKEAARREGMTVGEWLNQVIYSQAEGQSSGGEVEGLKLRDIITAIEHLKNRVVDAETKHARVSAELSRNMGAFVERVQRLERVKPAEGSYEDVVQRVDRLERAGGDKSRVDALRALEKAVGQVAVQFNNAQRMTITRLDSAEAQLQEFAERIDRVGESSSEPAELGSLKSAIEDLAQRVTRAEQIATEAAALKDSAESSGDPAFVEQTGARLRVLGDEIKRGGDQIRALEGTINKLSSQIEAAEKRSAEGVEKVSETIAEVRTQLLNDDAMAKDAPDIDAKLDEARKETEARIETLQQALNEMEARFADMDSAEPVDKPAAALKAAATVAVVTETAPDETADDSVVAPAAAIEAETEPTVEADAPAAEAETDEDALDDVIDEIAEAVASMDAEFAEEPEAESGADPFAFDDEAGAEIVEAEAEDDAEDFSFELDDEVSGDNDEEDIVVSAEAEDDDEDDDPAAADAHTLLAEVRSALSGNGFAEGSDEADEADAVLAALDEDDEDTQAENTASLATGMALDTDQELTGEDDEEDPIDEFGSAPVTDEPEAAAAPADEKPEQPQTKEDLLQAARRRAKEAAAARSEEEEAARPRRGQLTAKQRAILAARARQKRAAIAAEAGDAETAANETPAPAMETPVQAHHDEEDEAPAGRFSKITAALAAARARITRKKTDEGEQPAAAEPSFADVVNETAPNRNGDRAALETLQSTASARPLTLALGVAILLAVAALAYLMKDIFVKPDAGQAQVTETANETAAGSLDGDLATVPEAPAIDPSVLFDDAITALNAAENEDAATAAIAKLQESAALGFPPAQLQLGELFKTGQGVDQDLGQARIWFRRAANGGNVLAMHRIGVMTARGDGGPADSAEAISWFERAANYGLVDSQYNLGAIYHPSEGGGAIQDAAKAYYWYSLAARNGDDQAQPLAAGVGAALSADERATIDGQVEAWAAQTTDPAANDNAATAQ